jgi:hypothetical protein
MASTLEYPARRQAYHSNDKELFLRWHRIKAIKEWWFERQCLPQWLGAAAVTVKGSQIIGHHRVIGLRGQEKFSRKIPIYEATDALELSSPKRGYIFSVDRTVIGDWADQITFCGATKMPFQELYEYKRGLINKLVKMVVSLIIAQMEYVDDGTEVRAIRKRLDAIWDSSYNTLITASEARWLRCKWEQFREICPRLRNVIHMFADHNFMFFHELAWQLRALGPRDRLAAALLPLVASVRGRPQAIMVESWKNELELQGRTIMANPQATLEDVKSIVLIESQNDVSGSPLAEAGGLVGYLKFHRLPG